MEIRVEYNVEEMERPPDNKDALTVSELIALLKEYEEQGHGEIPVYGICWSAIRKQDIRLATNCKDDIEEEYPILLIE
jgi:hypothetical protein